MRGVAQPVARRVWDAEVSGSSPLTPTLATARSPGTGWQSLRPATAEIAERQISMGKQKFDVVVEAVRYRPDGQVEWVRGYERRGDTFTDLVLIPREALVERLKAGEVFIAGRRISQMASTFEVTTPLRLVHQNGQDLIVTESGQPARDDLAGVPLL